MTSTTVDPARLYENERIHRLRWWMLVVLCTSLMIVIVGNSSLNVALPILSGSLGADTSELQWIVDAYSLVFAGILLTAGALGDRFGRKGALQFGLALFLAAVVAASFADSATWLIACRATMGLAAAFIMPSTLSILTSVFAPHERAKAIAIWAGISGGGAAIGPVASGLLLNHFGWASVFLVNVPFLVFALVAGRLLLPTSTDPAKPRLDPVGAGLSIVGIVALVYGIIEAPSRGWTSPETLAAFVGAVVVLALFGAWELRRVEPMLDLRFFRDRRLSVATGGMALVYFAMFGMFFLFSQLMQLVFGYDALEAGIRQAPMAVVLMAIAPNTPKLAARYGRNNVVAGGLMIAAVGILLFAQVQVDWPYPYLLASMVIMATGIALTISPLTSSILSGVPDGKAGVGSALNDTSRELGGALGVAVIGSLVASRYDTALRPALDALPAAARASAESSLSGALSVAARLGADGEALALAAKTAYVDGLNLALTIGAAVVLSAAIITWRLLPNPTPLTAAAAAADEFEGDPAPKVDDVEVAPAGN